MTSGRSARSARPRPSPALRARTAPAAPRARRAPAQAAPFWVRFWGVRGSIAVPGPATRRYGGNTACVEVRCGEERLVFDLGSGLRPLGEAHTGPAPFRATLFLSHYHYDHLQGLPFFKPLFDARNAFVCYGPTRNGRTVEDILSAYMAQPFFPVGAQEVFRARTEFRAAKEGERLKVGRATVTPLELNHPGGSLGYRVDFAGRSLVYATDLEHGTEADGRLAAFARGADVLIYDAMYTEDEYAGRTGPSRRGWGHSTWEAAVATAQAARVGRLVLFHHEPTREDAALERLLRRVRAQRPDALAAREGETLELL